MMISEFQIPNSKFCSIPKGTNVLVTGATGFTGLLLTKKLVKAGLKVSAIARHSSNLEPLEDFDIQWFRGDVFDKSTVAKAAKDAAYIFHVAAAFRDAKSSEQDYRNVHLESTKLLAYQALANPDFKRFIHISTIGVHGHIEDGPADENYRFSPGDGYQRTKAEAELWIRDFGKKQGLPFTVIRPAAIYGPGDKRLLKLFKMTRRKYFPLFGKGKCIYHLTHVDDLTNSFIIAATSPKALGEVFICGDKEPIAIADIARIVARTLGKQIKIVRIPIWPFFIAADLCEVVCRPFHIEPPIYRRRVAFYTKDRLFDTTKLRTVLGYNPVHSNEEGLVQTARWYVEQGWLKC
ncbi:NAD-dependent epimerase/dehydratase family protein [Desulfococcaceae bacterium HSG7]|nr:NAD-dependent epimerase/dehydratase family protein [Desulfococcaceae bacterium HSG7]